MSNRSIEHHRSSGTASEAAGWLEARLRRAGFDAAKASELVRAGRIDFHALFDLIDRGCPPDLAERIVAPLEDSVSQ